VGGAGIRPVRGARSVPAATRQPAAGARRLDCHYLITAWSPALASGAVEPALDEHHLLYAALAALVDASPLNATSVYGAGTQALAAVPESWRALDLPTLVVPPNGFHALPYFWGTMGSDSRWRAGAYLIVTVPVTLPDQDGGPIVTTRLLDTGLIDGTSAGPAAFQVAGRLMRRDGSPIAAGWLRLETTQGRGLGAVPPTPTVGSRSSACAPPATLSASGSPVVRSTCRT
jgi:Pvc16 N-terminal domain